MITGLGFLNLRVLATSLPSHLAFMSFSNASSSSLLFVSINNLSFFSDLKEFWFQWDLFWFLIGP